MKIAHLSAHYRPIIGGQEVYIANLMEVCRKAGHESIVYQLDRGEKSADTVCLPRLPYLARLIPTMDRKWLNYMVALFRPRNLFQADAIVSHYAYHAPPLEKVRSQTIILSHGVEWQVTNQSPADVSCEANAKSCLGRFLHVVNDTHYLRYLGLNVPPGEGFFTEVVPRAWFIPNCVDTRHFRAGPGLPEYAGKQMILVPRQMVVDRGIHLAIEAFAELAGEFPQLEMCLLGKRHRGTTPYIQRLDGLIRDHELQGRVYFRDPVANNEMPVWYNSAKLTLIPTVAREGTSLSALESMSCGVATVSTNVAGLADLPTVQCEPTPAAMAKALRETLKSAGKIGEQQQKTVERTFNMDNWTRAWMDVFNTIKSS